ncbi:protein FAM47E-like [Mastomys coucha]|uniref:protein FAM47E-like n=1 Tax=Mastomys coucha TaxID=35658 RepID=UPI001261A5FA|nr:protein FAM47E-like [Mastomys coucha]
MGDQKLPENQFPRLPKYKRVLKHKTEQQIVAPLMEDLQQQFPQEELDDFTTDYEPHEEILSQTNQGIVLPRISHKVGSIATKSIQLPSQLKLPKDLGMFPSISTGQQGIRTQYKLDHLSQMEDDAEDYVINLKEQTKCDQNLNKWPPFENQMKAKMNSKHGKDFHRKLNLRPPENSKLGQKDFFRTYTHRSKKLLDSLNSRCTQRGGDNIDEWDEELGNLDVLQQCDMDYVNQPTCDEFSEKINSYLPSKLKYFRGLSKGNGTKFSKQKSKFEMKVQKPHDLSMSTKKKYKYGPPYHKLKPLKTQAVKEPLHDPKSLNEIEGKSVCKPDTLENLYGAIAFKDFIVDKGYHMPGILKKYFRKKGWNYNSVNTPIPSVLKYHEMMLQKMDDEDDETSEMELD